MRPWSLFADDHVSGLPRPDRQTEGDAAAEQHALEPVDDHPGHRPQALFAEQARQRIQPHLRSRECAGHQIQARPDEMPSGERQGDRAGRRCQAGEGGHAPAGPSAGGGHAALRESPGRDGVPDARGRAEDQAFERPTHPGNIAAEYSGQHRARGVVREPASQQAGQGSADGERHRARRARHRFGRGQSRPNAGAAQRTGDSADNGQRERHRRVGLAARHEAKGQPARQPRQRAGRGRAKGCGRPPGRGERQPLTAPPRHQRRDRAPAPGDAEQRDRASIRGVPSRVPQDGPPVLVARPLVEPPKRRGGPELVESDGGIVSLLVGRLAVNPLPQQDAQQRRERIGRRCRSVRRCHFSIRRG